MNPINPNLDIEIKGNCTNFKCCFPFPTKKKKTVKEDKVDKVADTIKPQSQNIKNLFDSTSKESKS